MRAAADRGVEVLTLYAFSSENWRRSDEEIADLTGLMRYYLERELTTLDKEGVRLKLIGDYSAFGAGSCRDASRAPSSGPRRTAADAGDRAQLRLARGDRRRGARACRGGGRRRIDPEAIDEAAIEAKLETADLPPLDLLIRTRARCGCPISCCGRRPMPNCCSSTSCGPTSTSRPSATRSTSSLRASGASVAGERARSSAPSTGIAADRRRARSRRSQGGYIFAVLVAAAATAMFTNGRGSSRGWGFGWQRRAASSTRCCRRWRCCGSATARRPGLTLLLWVFIVTWSTDIGAYFAGRGDRRPKLAPSISPNKTVAGPGRRHGRARRCSAAPGRCSSGLRPALYCARAAVRARRAGAATCSKAG